MNTLAIDTCDQRGTVAVRLDGRCLGLQIHGQEEYSSWLLPAVERALVEAQKKFTDLSLLAVATGPGSFTGVRIGLCAVKAWAEVYGIKIVGVSRLAALATSVPQEGWIAATYDAHRGQIFAGLYYRASGKLTRQGEERVSAPEEFLSFVRQQTEGATVHWASLDPKLLTGPLSSLGRSVAGHEVWPCEPRLANAIAEIAEEKAACGEFSDVLELDANYVRRSDAEILWKGPAHRGR